MVELRLTTYTNLPHREDGERKSIMEIKAADLQAGMTLYRTAEGRGSYEVVSVALNRSTVSIECKQGAYTTKNLYMQTEAVRIAA
jgi:hypothetical protein